METNVTLIGVGGRDSWFVQTIPRIGENVVAIRLSGRGRSLLAGHDGQGLASPSTRILQSGKHDEVPVGRYVLYFQLALRFRWQNVPAVPIGPELLRLNHRFLSDVADAPPRSSPSVASGAPGFHLSISRSPVRWAVPRRCRSTAPTRSRPVRRAA